MRHLISKIIITILVVLSISTGSEAKSCDVTAQNGVVSFSWDRSFSYYEVNLQLIKHNFDSCSVTLGFSTGGSSNYDRSATNSGGYMHYQLYKDLSTSVYLKDGVDILAPDESITAHFADGTELVQNIIYYIKIDSSRIFFPEYVKAGSYSDSFNVRIYDQGVMSIPTNETQVQLSVTMPQILELSLAQVGGSFDPSSVAYSVNFGNLEYSRQESLNLLVRTNVGYKVSLSSLNGGVLKHENSSYYDSIPYSLIINDVSYSLQKTFMVVDTYSGVSTNDGISSLINIVTQQANNVQSGNYSDRITVIVEPND